MKIKKKDFTCERDGYIIHGRQYLPEGDKLPIVIVSHEFLTGQFSVRRYARQLAMLGYAAFCFDFVGGGAVSSHHSEMTVWTELDDLLAVMRYAAKLPETDGERLYLMGCSQGGLVSALAAARLRNKITGLVLFYPALSIPDDARAGDMIFNTRFDTQIIPDTIRCGPFTFSGDYAETLLDLDVFGEIAKYTGPVLIVHGTGDRIVDHSYSVRAKEAYGKNCELVLIPNAGHIFPPIADLPAVRAVKSFMPNFSMK